MTTAKKTKTKSSSKGSDELPEPARSMARDLERTLRATETPSESQSPASVSARRLPSSKCTRMIVGASGRSSAFQRAHPARPNETSRLGPSARADRTSSRLVSDFEPGTVTVACTGAVADGAGHVVPATEG